MDGNFEDVLSAQFSPDGDFGEWRTVQADTLNEKLRSGHLGCRLGGKKLVSLPADLLGSQAKGTQGKVVGSF